MTRTETTLLKPCPFCGGEGSIKRIYGIDGFAFVECLQCGAIGETAEGDAEAIEAWNTRAERTCKDTGWYGCLFTCSACGETEYEGLFPNYCPHCGAKVIGSSKYEQGASSAKVVE